MADSDGTIFKMVVFIGLVLFFASMLAAPWVYIGQPVPPDSAWGQFSSAASSFPTFSNPFAAPTTFTSSLNPAQSVTQNFWNGSGVFPPGLASTHGTDHGCGNTTYWHCVDDPNGQDGNATFLQLQNQQPGHFAGNLWVGALQFAVNLTGQFGHFLTSVILQVNCNTPVASPIPVRYQLAKLTTFSPNVTAYTVIAQTTAGTVCANPQRDQPYPVSLVDLSIEGGCSSGGVWDSTTGPCATSTQITLLIDPTVNATVRFTYLQAVASWSSETIANCTGPNFFGNVGCQLAQGLGIFLKGVLFVFNGFVFFFQVIFWFVVLLGTFVTSVGSLFTGSGAPPLVAGLLGVLIVGILVFVGLVLLGKARPSGGGV